MSYAGLEKKDLYVVFGLVFLLLAGSYVSSVLGLPIQVEVLMDVMGFLVIMGSLYYVYHGVGITGGTAARSMTLIGGVVGYYGLTILPHIYYHITHPSAIGPFKGAAVESFLHASTSMAFLVMAWGLYVFYRGGKN